MHGHHASCFTLGCWKALRLLFSGLAQILLCVALQTVQLVEAVLQCSEQHMLWSFQADDSIKLSFRSVWWPQGALQHSL
jgi:hypothetical protein